MSERTLFLCFSTAFLSFRIVSGGDGLSKSFNLKWSIVLLHHDFLVNKYPIRDVIVSKINNYITINTHTPFLVITIFTGFCWCSPLPSEPQCKTSTHPIKFSCKSLINYWLCLHPLIKLECWSTTDVNQQVVIIITKSSIAFVSWS